MIDIGNLMNLFNNFNTNNSQKNLNTNSQNFSKQHRVTNLKNQNMSYPNCPFPDNYTVEGQKKIMENLKNKQSNSSENNFNSKTNHMQNNYNKNDNQNMYCSNCNTQNNNGFDINNQNLYNNTNYNFDQSADNNSPNYFQNSNNQNRTQLNSTMGNISSFLPLITGMMQNNKNNNMLTSLLPMLSGQNLDISTLQQMFTNKNSSQNIPKEQSPFPKSNYRKISEYLKIDDN